MKNSVEIPTKLLNLDKTVLKAIKNGITDCTDDLLRVASLRTPVDTTTLEKSGSSKVESNAGKVAGTVSFKAMNNGFNYALKMDRGKYNLGKKSISKSSRGVRSKFTNQALKVGSGYLSDTAEKCQKGYTEYLNHKIYESITQDGFNVFKRGK